MYLWQESEKLQIEVVIESVVLRSLWPDEEVPWMLRQSLTVFVGADELAGRKLTLESQLAAQVSVGIEMP